MRTLPAALQTMLEERPEDGVELLEMIDVTSTAVRMSSHGADIVVPSTGNTFLGFPGFDRGDIVFEAGGRPARVDIRVPVYSDGLITPLQIRRGVWRQSTVRLWLADRTDPDAQALILKGVVGKTSTSDGITGIIEIATLAERNVDIILPKVGAGCSYDFGAGFGGVTGCGVNVGALAIAATVASVVVDRLSFVATISNPSGYDFSNGALKFTSGDNTNVAGQVRLWTSATARIDLLRPMPYDIAPGDAFSIHPGCKRTLADCTAFGGLNYWPGYVWAPGENSGSA